MLRLAALLAVLFNVLASALPAGSVVHVDRAGGIALEGASCCATNESEPDLVAAHGQSRTVHCCCFIGVVIGHADVHLGLPASCDLPALPPSDAWRSVGPFARAPSAIPGTVSRLRDHPPPSLGALRPDTIVIRC